MMLAAINVNVDYKRIETFLGFKGESLPYSRLHLLSRIQSDIQVTLQQGDLQSLMTAIDLGTPPTVFISTSELPYWSEAVYHAVVLVGYTETDFLINDPAFARAPQVASIGNLDLAWLEYDSYFAVVQRRSR